MKCAGYTCTERNYANIVRRLSFAVSQGSLRAAAEEIRTDPSNVTRRLSGLEDRLGVRLINRSRPVDSN